MMQIAATLGILLLILILFFLLLLLIAIVSYFCGFGFKKVYKKGLWAMLLPPLIMIYGVFVGSNFYEVKKVTIESEKLPESFDSYRIVQISDLHLPSFGYREFSLKKAVKMINALEPDLVVFTGDIITYSANELTPSLKEILKSINAKDGVLAVMGNHDYGFYAFPDTEQERLWHDNKVRAYIGDLRWKLLSDENIFLHRGGDSLSVIGVENISVSRPFASLGDLDKAMAGNLAGFKILLSHDPDHWRLGVLGKTDIDLTLSGHTHAMQLSLFGWTPSKYMFKEYRGLYSEDAGKGIQTLYVNIGLGETGFLARIGARPEITLLTLRRKV